jgi:hypothetical protein
MIFEVRLPACGYDGSCETPPVVMHEDASDATEPDDIAMDGDEE